MSMTAPPNQRQPSPLPQPASPLTLKQRLTREYHHWADLPWRRFALLIAPVFPQVYLDPLLPFVAYALWLWASSSWAWRDRWASIWALSRRGGMFVGVVLLYAALSNAQVWILPQLTAALQHAWSAHLPGELSLSPFAPSSVARTLLLLPLAPALALYFEYIDPRTRVQQQRILTARDLAPKKPKVKQNAAPTAQEAAPQEPAPRAKPKPKAKPGAPRETAKQQSESPPPPPEQITIDSYLASDKDQAPARPAPPPRPAGKKQQAAQAETPAPAPSKQIDWNDVAE